MKRAFLYLAAVAALLLCAGCNEDAPESTPTPIVIETPEPTPTPTPEPPSTPGTVRAGGICPLYRYLNRGDEITVTGSLENYLVISYEDVSMLVEKRFIRLESESAPEKWTGYAKSGAAVYDSAYLTGEVTANPELNTVVDVLDSFDGVLYIEWDGLNGYIAADQISENETPVYSYGGGGAYSGAYSGGYSGGGGSSAGGGSSGGGGGGAPAGGQDGGDIALGYRTGETGGIVLLGNITYETKENKASKPAKAAVLTGRFPVYLCELKRGDAVKITQQGEGDWSVLFNGKIGTVPSALVRLDSDAEYTQWTGYAVSNAGLYSDYKLNGTPTLLEENTLVTILDDLGSCYVADVGGTIGYIGHDGVSESEIVHYYGGGGGGGGGGSTGGGGGSTGGGTPEWTEPLL